MGTISKEINDFYEQKRQESLYEDTKFLFMNIKNPIIIEGNNSNWNDIKINGKIESTRSLEDKYRNSNIDGKI